MERVPGGRSELDPSGVLFLFAAMWLADMVEGVMDGALDGVRGRNLDSAEAWLAAERLESHQWAAAAAEGGGGTYSKPADGTIFSKRVCDRDLLQFLLASKELDVRIFRRTAAAARAMQAGGTLGGEHESTQQ